MKLSEIQQQGLRTTANSIRRRYPHKFFENWHEKPRFREYSYSNNYTLNPYPVARQMVARYSMKRRLCEGNTIQHQ